MQPLSPVVLLLSFSAVWPVSSARNNKNRRITCHIMTRRSQSPPFSVICVYSGTSDIGHSEDWTDKLLAPYTYIFFDLRKRDNL